MRRARGFTIIEVLIVVIVVGILASLGTFAFGQVQRNVRNDERAVDIGVIADALERYHDKYHAYPSCSSMTQSIGTVADLLGIDKNALTTPSAGVGVNSITCSALTSGGPDAYGYIGNSGTECATGAFCTEFTLQYKREGSNEIVSTESIR